MSRTSKSFTFFTLFSVILLGAFDQTTVIAQSISTSPPVMEWEHEYGYHFTEITSGLIQTIDGGYVFIDIGWSHGHTLAPSVLYKTDSHGNVEWQKRFNTYEKTPTLIKCDSTGNIQWVQNYTSKLPAISGSSSKIVLYDGSVISIESGNIVKKDSNGTLQWQIESKFSYYGDSQTELSSLIVTSDGAIAVLGVKVPVGSSMWAGNMYLIKTESFLPKPSPMVLPTPIPTPITISNSTLTLAILTIVVIIAFVISLLLFRRHRKPISQNKPNV
jgi:hypothetical protein